MDDAAESALREAHAKLSELGLLPGSAPDPGELLPWAQRHDQDEWLLPLSLWSNAGILAQVPYRTDRVPDYAGHLAQVAALDGNPYDIRDVSVTPPAAHLLEREHAFLRGPMSSLTYRSTPGGEHHAVLSALSSGGERHDLGRELPQAPLPDGRSLLEIRPSLRPRGGDQVFVVVLARYEAVLEYQQWARARRGRRPQPSTAWGISDVAPGLSPHSAQEVAAHMRDQGTDPVLAHVVAVPETPPWDRHVQIESLVAADRAGAHVGLRATWDAVGDDPSMRERAAAAAVLLAEVFGNEQPLREALTWPPDSPAWSRLHPASALAPDGFLQGYTRVRRRLLGPRVLETLQARLADSEHARGQDFRITPFVTIEWATDLALDDRVDGASTIYLPLLRRHAVGGNQSFVEKVLAAARAGTPDAAWLQEPLPSQSSPDLDADLIAEADAVDVDDDLREPVRWWFALREAGLLPKAVVAAGPLEALRIPYLETDDPQEFALQVLEEAGRARTVPAAGEVEPPYPDVLRALQEVSGGRAAISDIEQEPADVGESLLRWTRAGERFELAVDRYGARMDLYTVQQLLPTVVDQASGHELQLWEIGEDAEVVAAAWAVPGAWARFRELTGAG